MGGLVFKNAKCYLDGFNFTGDMNALALEASAEQQDETVLNLDTRSNLPGLKVASASLEGFWNGGAGAIDETLFGKVGGPGSVLTMAPLTGADGELAYTMLAEIASYAPGGAVGEIFKFSVKAQAQQSDLVRGAIMLAGAKTVTGNGVARQLGAVAAGKKVFAALHVIGVSGTAPTFDCVLKSAATNFASPTNRITFAQKTVIGSEWQSLAGPITDTWWRLDYTLGGVGPSFDVLAVVGIQ